MSQAHYDIESMKVRAASKITVGSMVRLSRRGNAVPLKFDIGKPRTDLLPPQTLLNVSRVLGFGANKYADYNYRKGKGLTFGKMYSAALRHQFKWWGGENLDEETGLNHIYHAITELCMIADCIERKKGIDDRP